MPSRSATDYPKLLVLSGAIPETRFAGSLLLYRLLQGYPADRLLAVGPTPSPQSELLACRYAHLRPAASARLNLTRFAEMKRSFEAVGLAGQIPLSSIAAALAGFQPDVVVSVMERHDYADAAYRFCREHHLPLVLIVHDRLESFELVYPPFRAAQIQSNARIYRAAAARLCVSAEMVDSLEQIYGARGTVLYPNRSEFLTPRPAESSARLKNPPQLTIGYAGSLSYGYGIRIREAMPLLADAQVQLHIYSHDRLGDAVPGIEHCGGFPATELWEKIKSECDAVWLPYSHHEHFRPLYRTHFPSKLTEYMALGMPVLITGPADATGVKWGLKNPGAALTVSDDSVVDIRDAAARLRTDANLRTTLATDSRGGNRDFDPVAIRQQFIQVLRDVAPVNGQP